MLAAVRRSRGEVGRRGGEIEEHKEEIRDGRRVEEGGREDERTMSRGRKGWGDLAGWPLTTHKIAVLCRKTASCFRNVRICCSTFEDEIDH